MGWLKSSANLSARCHDRPFHLIEEQADEEEEEEEEEEEDE